MKRRVAIWAIVGVLVAACWGIVSWAIRITPAEQIVWNLARFSCPIVFVGFYFHFGVRLYWVLVANAAIYALIGMTVETMLRARNGFQAAPGLSK
jgi:hypothetical protein